MATSQALNSQTFTNMFIYIYTDEGLNAYTSFVMATRQIEKKQKKNTKICGMLKQNTCVTPAEKYKKQRQFKCKSKYTSDYYTAQGAKNSKEKRKMAKMGRHSIDSQQRMRIKSKWGKKKKMESKREFGWKRKKKKSNNRTSSEED